MQTQRTTRLRQYASKIRDYTSKHFFGMTLFVAIYSIFGITVQFFLIGNITWLNVLLALLVVVFPAGITVWFTTDVAETNPSLYVKTMKVREYFKYIFWSLAVIVVVLWVSLMVFVLRNPNALPVEYSWILPVFTFAYVGSALLEALFIGSSLGTAIIALLFKEKANKFYRLNARTYLRVAADSMSSSCNPNEIFCFTNGITYLNELLKTKYRLQLKKSQELSNYFKTTAFAGDEKEKQRVKQATDCLVEKLKEDIRLNDVVAATRNICGKTIECTLDEKASELDYEIGIKKWFTEHIESIGLIVAIVSVAVAIIWH